MADPTLAYLLFVSFLTGSAADLSGARAEALCASPYDGIAAWYSGPYEHGEVAVEARSAAFAEAARATGKQVWPWVFLNRMIGHAADPKAPAPAAWEVEQKRWFEHIPGIDLDGSAGDRAAFLEDWRGALRTARRIGAPGILADFEAYNDYRVYKLAYLAGRRGVAVETVRAQLGDLGATLADIALEEYPQAVIWLTFSGLGDRKWAEVLQGGFDYRSITYVVIGLLERVQERGGALAVVSGGMVTHGYCTGTIDAYARMIAARKENYADALARYPNLRLGGTIAPWNDGARRTGWLRSNCGRAPQRRADDFVPFFRQLLTDYRYVWIYGAGVSDYRPWDPASAAEMDQALLAARAAAGGGP